MDAQRFDCLDKSRSHPETSHVERSGHVLPPSPLASHTGMILPSRDGARGSVQGQGWGWGSSPEWTGDFETPFVVGNSAEERC